MNDAIGKRKRGVWIGVYVLVEVFAFAAYLFAGALVMTGRKDGMMLDEVWDVIQILLFLLIAAVEIGYALIWRMAVMYRGIRHRTFWIVLNNYFLGAPGKSDSDFRGRGNGGLDVRRSGTAVNAAFSRCGLPAVGPFVCGAGVA